MNENKRNKKDLSNTESSVGECLLVCMTTLCHHNNGADVLFSSKFQAVDSTVLNTHTSHFYQE